MANAEDIPVCTIIEKIGREVCGFCQLEHADASTPQIEIDIRDGYVERGYV